MSKPNHHLIHANVALARASLDHPRMADFVRQADAIDALARQSPGFVGQPTPADEGQTFTDRALLNLSIWTSVESLEAFTHTGRHALVLQRRADWFLPQDGPNYVLYWAPAGHTPTEAEIAARLHYLAHHGPTPYAFTFDRPYTAVQALA
ncbi:MAG: DUF3291 domain-containing protein, partial [Candidatus Promineifilaceae bacterium]|nr:DUF3291 domain-containing protein [Candidatus Promineifilaceae bacterium]